MTDNEIQLDTNEPIKEEHISDISLKHFKKDAKTNVSRKNIKKTLDYSLNAKYGIEDEEIRDAILSVHGLDKKRFDFVNSIENLINKQIADESIDQNANKNEKTIEGIMQEAFNPIRKLIGYDLLYRTLKTLYGKPEAKRLSGEMYDMSLAINDSTKLTLPYCFSINASQLVLEGRPFGQLHSKPPKRISSYISALCETIHQMSNHLAGAIAVSTFFLDIAHLLIYKENINLDQIKNDIVLRKYVENEYQQFVYSVNHLSRASNESPFTNLSIFDKEKLKGLISEDNFAWYFPNDLKIEQEKHNEYIINYIYELQNIFLDLFDLGDPCADGRPIRFPVVTVNISKKKTKLGYKVEDEAFLDNICNRDIFRYNVFASETNKFASCCLAFDTPVEIYTGYFIERNTIEKIYDKYQNKTVLIKANGEYRKGKPIRLNKRTMYKITLEDGRFLTVTDNHRNYTYKGVKETTDLTTSDYLECVQNDNPKLKKKKNHYYIKIDSVKKIKYTNDYVYCFEMEDQNQPFFELPNGIITGNCRLINDSDLMDLGSQVNSFGAGSSVSLGSHRVVTINFNRLALENKSIDKFFKHLDMRIEDTAKILKAHMELIKLLTSKHLQMFIDNGWIRLDRLFSTFGINGLYECVENLKKYKDFEEYSKLDFTGEILVFLNKKVAEYSKKYGIKGNIEFIPAEATGKRLAYVDSLIFGQNKVPQKLYSNQFLPLWENATLWERLEIDGKYNKLITGGGIVHAQIGEKVTPTQAKSIIKHSIKCGCEHFALNSVYSECVDGHNEFGNYDVCPKCGKEIKEKYTRVVGFFTPVSSWNDVRREWEFPNRKFVDLSKIKNEE